MSKLVSTHRKKSRQPSSLNADRQQHQSHSIDPSINKLLHLRYPAAVIQQCRTGHTRLIHIKQFKEQTAYYQETLTQITTNREDGAANTDLSVSDLLIAPPHQIIQSGIDKEIDIMARWLNEASEAQREAMKEMKQQDKEYKKLVRRSQRKRNQSKAEIQTEDKKEQEEEKSREDQLDNRYEKVKNEVMNDSNPVLNNGIYDLRSGAQQLKGCKRTKGAYSIASSLSSPSTSTSHSHISSTLLLPESFGSYTSNYHQIIQPLKEGIQTLPSSLLVSAPDHNMLTAEAFDYNNRLRILKNAAKEMEIKQDQRENIHETDISSLPNSALSSDSILIRVSIYAANSSRLQSQLVLHDQQTLNELVEMIECRHNNHNNSDIQNTQQPAGAEEDSITSAGMCTSYLRLIQHRDPLNNPRARNHARLPIGQHWFDS